VNAGGTADEATHDASAPDAERVAVDVEIRLENGSRRRAAVLNDDRLFTGDAALAAASRGTGG